MYCWRLTEHQVGYQEILYQVAWTFNLFTLHPLVLCGGQLGLIYVIDAVTRSCVRILRGHGAVIFIHPSFRGLLDLIRY